MIRKAVATVSTTVALAVGTVLVSPAGQALAGTTWN